MTLEDMLREKVISGNNHILVSIDANGVGVDIDMKVFDFYTDDDGWYFIEDENDNAIHFKVNKWNYQEEQELYFIECCDDTFITIQAY